MLGVEDKGPNQRRASLVSEIYSEQNQGSIIKKSGGDSNKPRSASGCPPVNVGPAGGGNNTVVPKIRPPPDSVLRRQVPKGKFGLIGLGKLILCVRGRFQSISGDFL